MASITQVSRLMDTLFEAEAPALARQFGLRQRVFSPTRLAQLLVLGWWLEPHAGSSCLARLAGTWGIRTSKQAIEAHFTRQTAQWLLALLQRAVAFIVQAQPILIPLLERFQAVLLEDSSTIALPESLQSVWQGSGGSGPAASLKLSVRWDWLSGRLQGPYLQAGRAHEQRSPLSQQPIAAGSLWLGDLGYFSLHWLAQLQQQAVCFVMRYKDPTSVWDEHGHRLDLLAVLAAKRLQPNQMWEQPVQVGSSKRVAVRVLVMAVPEQVVEQRRARLKEQAHKKGKAINARQWELAQWTILLTNVASSQLSGQHAMALMRTRWQIELLFKLWKEQGCIDEWRTRQPERILCELYAKLLAMVLQHWLLLLSCWDDPQRSWACAAHVVREHVSTLILGVSHQLTLSRAVRCIVHAVKGSCRIPKRQGRPSTSRLLTDGLDWGLT